MHQQQNKLSTDLHNIVQNAQHEAAERHAIYTDVEHLMLSLLSHPSGIAHRLFQHYEVDVTTLYEQVAATVGIKRESPVETKGYSREAVATLERAASNARTLDHKILTEGHLLLALMGETKGAVHTALNDFPLDENAMRAYLNKNHAPEATEHTLQTPAPTPVQLSDVIVVPTLPSRAEKKEGVFWQTLSWPVIAVGVLIIYLIFVLPQNSMFTFALVLGGWIFSLTLHEFSHALVAYWGGDHTVKDKGYLSFNPLKYTHPMMSIIMPLIFLAMGRIGLPGGAVYIERHRLRNKWWGAAVSAAGPTANLLFALLLAAPFFWGKVDIDTVRSNLGFEYGKNTLQTHHPDLTESELRQLYNIEEPGLWGNPTLWSAVALLILFQMTAVALNLLPIPPLDGFGILEPFLDPNTQYQLRSLGRYGIMLVFVALWFVPQVSNEFWNTIYEATDALHIPGYLISEGFENLMFWRTPPG